MLRSRIYNADIYNADIGVWVLDILFSHRIKKLSNHGKVAFHRQGCRTNKISIQSNFMIFQNKRMRVLVINSILNLWTMEILSTLTLISLLSVFYIFHWGFKAFNMDMCIELVHRLDFFFPFSLSLFHSTISIEAGVLLPCNV